jgi:CHAT domain-containing protein
VTERHSPLSHIELFGEVLWRAPGMGLSFLAAAVTSWWKVLAAVAYVFLYLKIAVTVGAAMFLEWGLSSGQAKLLAASLALLGTLLLAIVALRPVTAAYSRGRPTRLLVLLAFATPTVFLFACLYTSFDIPLPAAMAITAAFGYLSFRYVIGSMSKLRSPVRSQIWLDDPTKAGDLVRECEDALADPALTPAERAAVECNLASGLAALSHLSVSDDGLPRAYEILTRRLPEMDPVDGYLGAARLVEAMGTKASRTGDIEGYDEALRLMLDAASVYGAELRCVMARARLIQATHLAELSGLALSHGEPGRAARLHQEALDGLLGVIEHSSSHSTVHALAQVKFASLTDRAGGDLDSAIALCRAALRWRLRSRLERDFARGVLCGLLTDRARAGGPRARRDRAEAMRLCRRLLRSAASRAEAVRRLPTLMRLNEERPVKIASAYRGAFAELSVMSGDSASDLAAEWAAWAIASSDAAEAGEAHWCWIRAVRDDARRRPGLAEKQRRLSRFLGMAAQTGECLIEAGRERDAAVALDLGRAMLLTERMSRARGGIAERLDAAGCRDLAARWRAAQVRISEADRAAFSRGHAPSRTMLVRGRRFEQRFTSSGHLALADLEDLLREIVLVPGFEDVDAPPAYDYLSAAAHEGPIVYLSATVGRARAVIVTQAPQPVVITLEPAVDLASLARRLVDAPDTSATMDLLSSTIPLLWTALMEPVAAHLPAGALVTLIPVGALSLLPLHVAGLLPDDGGVWHDHTDGLVFRYAPNARVLALAQSQAGSLAGRRLRVLTVDVADARGESPLPCAAQESAGVVARFGTSRVQRPSPASRAAVLGGMDTCGIWHFACHGVHRPTDPLESSLVLTDGRLSLRAVFARPPADRRLAVLSACRTAAPDRGLLDEVVSFPSALLQAGFAGVVCAQSDVVDRAAMLLVLRFFDELELCDSPAHALSRAQAWLRAATNQEIHAELGNAHPPDPSGESPADLAHWNARRDFMDPINWAPLSYSGA